MLLTLAACKQRQLKVIDLKFADFENQQIERNRVDTMFLISKSDAPCLSGSDTVGYQAYDCVGNLLAQKETGPNGNLASCKYDSVCLLKHKTYNTDFAAEYDMAYRFDPDNGVLYQYWRGSTNDTSIFKFDGSGNLVEDVGCSDVDSGRQFHYRTNYSYNAAGQLTQKKRVLLVSPEILQELEQVYQRAISTADTTDFYYARNKLEYTITSFDYDLHPTLNYSSKTYYNDKGLREMTIGKANSITCYAYSTRKDLAE
jgi:hypothetical protein